MVTRSDRNAKVYTRKELVLLETSINFFHEENHILEIKKLEFHLPHVRILRTHHRGKERREAFNPWRNLHDILCPHDYAERLVSSFAHQIQS